MIFSCKWYMCSVPWKLLQLGLSIFQTIPLHMFMRCVCQQLMESQNVARYLCEKSTIKCNAALVLRAELVTNYEDTVYRISIFWEYLGSLAFLIVKFTTEMTISWQCGLSWALMRHHHNLTSCSEMLFLLMTDTVIVWVTVSLLEARANLAFSSDLS